MTLTTSLRSSLRNCMEISSTSTIVSYKYELVERRHDSVIHDERLHSGVIDSLINSANNLKAHIRLGIAHNRGNVDRRAAITKFALRILLGYTVF